MRVRWTKLLPGYPAVLLVPGVLGLWAWLNLFRIGDWIESSWGFPLTYLRRTFEDSGTYCYEFQVTGFLFDLFLGLAGAFLIALGVERLVLVRIRAAVMRKRGPGESI